MFTFNLNMNLISLGRNFTPGTWVHSHKHNYFHGFVFKQISRWNSSWDCRASWFEENSTCPTINLKEKYGQVSKILRVLEPLYLSQTNLSKPLPPTSSSSVRRFWSDTNGCTLYAILKMFTENRLHKGEDNSALDIVASPVRQTTIRSVMIS